MKTTGVNEQDDGLKSQWRGRQATGQVLLITSGGDVNVIQDNMIAGQPHESMC